jgi:hypothetical protein|tara:strand:- start:18 stop:281 length:264 start_codon:yes stop_codon:yes gene_type:complete
MTNPEATAARLFFARRTLAFGHDLSLAICRRNVSLSLFAFRNLPFRIVRRSRHIGRRNVNQVSRYRTTGFGTLIEQVTAFRALAARF